MGYKTFHFDGQNQWEQHDLDLLEHLAWKFGPMDQILKHTTHKPVLRLLHSFSLAGNRF